MLKIQKKKKLDTEISGFHPGVTGWEVTELSGILPEWRECPVCFCELGPYKTNVN